MDEDIESIMSEAPGGENFGRASHTYDDDPDIERFGRSLNAASHAAEDHVRQGGVSIVEPQHGRGRGTTYGARDAGMTAHRGVTHPDEYVDRERLLRTVEAELGFSLEEVHSVYARGIAGRGVFPANLRELRDRLDRRVLALFRAGGNMGTLAEVLDIDRLQLVRAVSRAQGAEDGSWA